MGIRKRKPTSAGRRFQTVSDFAEITKSTPEKTLLAPSPRTGGRNSMVARLLVTAVVATSSNTVLSTSSATKMQSLQKLLLLNTIQTARAVLHFCITPTVKRHTSWLLRVSK